MTTEHLTDAERACTLRALHIVREQLTNERARIIVMDKHMSKEQRARLLEVENELVCLTASITWFWRQA